MKFSLTTCVLILLADILALPVEAQRPGPSRLPEIVRIENRQSIQNTPSRPLRPASDSGEKGPAAESQSTLTQSVLRVAGSLAIVLALFFLLIWLLRRVLPRQAGQLPSSIFQQLGTASLSPRHTVQLIQFGDRLLLVSLAAGQATTLAEVTDPNEVERLLRTCTPSLSHSNPTRPLTPGTRDEFQHIFDQTHMADDTRIVS